MIKAVFFDFYNTLVYFWPRVEEIQEAACQELGLSVSKEAVRLGYIKADQCFNEENATTPLSFRSSEEQGRFFARYEQLILEGAGLSVSLRLASQVWEMAGQVPKDLALFDDVIPTLKSLKKRGSILGVLSNLRRNMDDLSRKLGLEPYLHFCLTSSEAGAEKPHAPIFQAALARAGVEPTEAIHVGDQYQSDVLGAKAVGITPVLLDRDGWHNDVADCATIKSLLDLDGVLAEQGG